MGRMATKPRPAISVSLEREVLEKIDRSRGLIPRSAWINEALKRFIGEGEADL